MPQLAVAALGGAAVLGTVGTAVVQITVGVGLSLVGQALSGQQRAAEAQGLQQTVTTRGGVTPQTIILGRAATGGNLVAPPYSNGEGVGGVPNVLHSAVYDVSNYPVTGLNALWIDDTQFVPGTTLIADGASGTLTSGRGAVPDPTSGVRASWYAENGDSALYVRYFDGTQTTADDWLVSKQSAHPERPWASTAVGTETAYLRCTYRYDTDVYNGFPRVLFDVNGAALYDRRKDSTAGGSGTHRLGDSSTWEFTNNPVVMIQAVLRGIPLADGTTWGVGVSDDEMPYATWAAAADACDVTGDDGAPIYRAGIVASMATSEQGGDNPLSIVDELLKSCAGVISDVGGQWLIRVGEPGLPVASITDGDIYATKPEDFRPYPDVTEIFNGVRGTYPDAGAMWQNTEAPLRLDDSQITADGERIVANVNFRAVRTDEQVQRLCQAMLNDAARRRVHVITLPRRFEHTIDTTETISWTSERNGYTAKLFDVLQKAVDPQTLSITLAIREVDPDDYAWAPENLIETTAPSSEVVQLADFGLPGADAEAVTVRDASGGARRPDIKITWDADTQGVELVAWRVTVTATGTEVATGTSSEIGLGYAYVGGSILPATEYTVVIQGRRQRTATTSVTLTTPDVRLTSADIDTQITDAITLAQTTADDLEAAIIAALGGPLSPNLIPQQLDLKAREIDVAEKLDSIASNLASLQTLWQDTETKISDAGIYVDPENGTVKIEAVNRLDDTVGQVSIGLDAAAAAIELRATFGYVDTAVSNALLDPTQIPIVDGLDLRLSTVELDLDAAEAALTAKAETTTVNGIDTRLTTAELDIDSLEAEILLKVEQADFDAVESRVTTAEVTLSALDGASITSFVQDQRSTYDALEAGPIDTLGALLTAYEDREALRVDTAYVRQDLRALVDEDRESIATLRTELGTTFDDAIALIETESLARASADTALAAVSTALNARLTTVEADGSAAAISSLQSSVTSIEGVNTAQASSITSIVAEIEDLQTDQTGTASALSALTTTVTSIDGELTALSGSFDAYVASVNSSLSSITSVNAAQATSLSALTTRTTAVEAVAAGAAASATTNATAIATVEGYQAATLSFAAKAGGAAGEIVIVASDDPAAGAVSGITLSADMINLIGTANINGEAITIPRFVRAGSGASADTISGSGVAGATTLATIVMKKEPYPTFLQATMQVDTLGGSDQGRIEVFLTRTVLGTETTLENFHVGLTNARDTKSFTAVDDATAGFPVVTYRLKAAILSGNVGTPRAYQRTLQLQQFQR